MHSSVLAWRIPIFQRACQVALVVKNLPANAGDVREAGSVPWLGRSPGGGHGNPLQYSGLENSMDGIVHGFPKSWTQLSEFHFTDYNTKYFLK